MATQPTVRNLQNVISQVGQSIQPQRELIQNQIAQNETSGEAQIAGLKAQQAQQFGNIEQTAQNKGMFFSGFSPDEQAKYTSTTFLPALAKVQEAIANTRNNLMMQNAQLDTNVFNRAFDSVEQDRQNVFTWDNTRASEQFTAGESKLAREFENQQRIYRQQFDSREAEIQRLWQAGESAKARQAERQLAQMKIDADIKLQQMADNAAATRASAAAQASAGPDAMGIEAGLKASAGNDGFVDPKDFHAARRTWISQGGKSDDFDNAFRDFVNPTHPQSYRLMN